MCTTCYSVTISNRVAFTASKIVVDREFFSWLHCSLAASKELLAKLNMTRGAFYLRKRVGWMRCGVFCWCVRISHSRLHACVPKMDIIKRKFLWEVVIAIIKIVYVLHQKQQNHKLLCCTCDWKRKKDVGQD